MWRLVLPRLWSNLADKGLDIVWWRGHGGGMGGCVVIHVTSTLATTDFGGKGDLETALHQKKIELSSQRNVLRKNMFKGNDVNGF